MCVCERGGWWWWVWVGVGGWVVGGVGEGEGGGGGRFACLNFAGPNSRFLWCIASPACVSTYGLLPATWKLASALTAVPLAVASPPAAWTLAQSTCGELGCDAQHPLFSSTAERLPRRAVRCISAQKHPCTHAWLLPLGLAQATWRQ